MLILIPRSRRTRVKSPAVNCEPWSVLKMVGRPKCARASLNASMQKPVSSVLDSRHARTRREYHVDDRHQVGEAARHRDVGDIRGPDLVRPCDREPPQQIRVDGVVRRRRARCGLWRRALQPHQPHQALDALPIDHGALGLQRLRDSSGCRRRDAADAARRSGASTPAPPRPGPPARSTRSTGSRPAARIAAASTACRSVPSGLVAASSGAPEPVG